MKPQEKRKGPWHEADIRSLTHVTGQGRMGISKVLPIRRSGNSHNANIGSKGYSKIISKAAMEYWHSKTK